MKETAVFALIFLVRYGCVALTCDGETERENRCGSRCEPKCTNVLHRAIPCPFICDPPACVCKEGFARHEGRCVRVRDCPFNGFTCMDPEREQVNRCGQNCEGTCADRNPMCTRACNGPPACVCKQGLYRLVNICVPPNECT